MMFVKGYKKVKVFGMNQARLLSTLVSNGVSVFNVEKISVKVMQFCVKNNECEKFFAITDKLCYNVMTVYDTGFGSKLIYCAKRLGFILGAIVFFVATVLPSLFVCKIEFLGNASVYSDKIYGYLQDCGVSIHVPFSKLDLDQLEVNLLKENDYLSFASLKKRGGTLIVFTELKTEPPTIIDSSILKLCSSVDGVVEGIKVYRGTAVVKVGDTVKVGDLLVDGVVEVKDTTVSSNVYATVNIVVTKTYEFFSEYDNMEDASIAYAEQECGQPAQYSVIKKQEKGCFCYLVTAKFLVTEIAG